MDAITAMRPRRLVGCLPRKFPNTNPTSSLPFFDNVTHLEISDSMDYWGTQSGFHHLRRLSHILLPVQYYYYATSDAVRVVKDLLSHCETLQVCVISHNGTTDDWYRPEALEPLERIDDARLVFILTPLDSRSDWRSFVNGEPDTWDYAEAVVATQRQTGCRVEARRVHGDTIPQPKVIDISSIQHIYLPTQRSQPIVISTPDTNDERSGTCI
jgi:hypothetical protein